MSYIGNPRKSFNVVAYNEQKARKRWKDMTALERRYRRHELEQQRIAEENETVMEIWRRDQERLQTKG